MSHAMKKGFTLVELLIVIAIIGILASIVLIGLRGAREAGRDARRVADLRSVQNALELYFRSCSHYPGGNDAANRCSTTNPPLWNSDGWASQFKDALVAKASVTGLPNDPLWISGDVPWPNYRYVTDQLQRRYIMGAQLEAGDPGKGVLADDYDGNQGTPPANFTVPAGTNFECTDGGTGINFAMYCSVF